MFHGAGRAHFIYPRHSWQTFKLLVPLAIVQFSLALCYVWYLLRQVFSSTRHKDLPHVGGDGTGLSSSYSVG